MNKTYENIRKTAIGQGDDYTTGCLLDYTYFKENKEQALDAGPRAIQQINFMANLDENNGATMFFIIKEAKETIFEFSQRTVKVLRAQLGRMQFHWIWFCLISLILINIRMTQSNSLNVKLSNSQLNKFKPAIKNENEVVLRLPSVIGD